MDEPQQTNDATNSMSPIETASKFAIPAALLVYFVGFATTSLYLTRFGVPANDFVEPQYVGAGIWTLLPLLFANFVIHLYDLDFPIFSRLKASEGDSRRRWWAKATGRVISSIAIAQALMMLTLVCVVPLIVNVGPRFSTLPNSTLAWLCVTSTIALGGMIASTTWAVSSLSRHAAEATPEGRAKHRARGIVSSTFALLFLLFHIGVFAAFVFPRIPMTLGGGKPAMVRFILKEEILSADANGRPAEAIAPELAFIAPETPGSRLSSVHALFKTTAEDYVVYNKARDGSTFFSRSLVDGYVVEREDQSRPVANVTTTQPRP